MLYFYTNVIPHSKNIVLSVNHKQARERILSLQIKTFDKMDHCFKSAPGNLNHVESKTDQKNTKDLNKMLVLLSQKNLFPVIKFVYF